MKKIKIKQGDKELISIDLEDNNLSDENVEEIEKFNEYEVDSYIIKFEDSVKLKETHDISNIEPKSIKEVILNLKQNK